MPQYKVKMTSGTSGPLNPAYMDFTVRAASSSAQQAQMLVYSVACLNVFAEEAVTVAGMEERTTIGTGPWLPVSFPVAEYEAARAEASTVLGGGAIPSLSDYASATVGHTAGASSGRGDSVCVNTRASSGGKNGRGRHFIPFLCRQTVDSTGLLNPAASVYIENAYRLLFKGVGSLGDIVDTDPAVYSKVTDTNYGINVVSVQQIPSRLRSRTK